MCYTAPCNRRSSAAKSATTQDPALLNSTADQALSNSPADPAHTHSTPASAQNSLPNCLPTESLSSSPPTPENQPTVSSPQSDANTTINPPQISIHPMITRSKNQITKPNLLKDGTVRYPLPKALLAAATTNSDLTEPTCFTVASKHPKWRQAMNNEFDALLNNQTWSLVPPHHSQNTIGCKWVFRIKRHADGSIEWYKARLVAKGFHQQPGIDYHETYSPVIKPTTVRLVLSLAISAGWSIQQIDIQNAFLHGHLSEEVFMTQPPGFQHPQYPHHVCKLNKALYGLKQAPQAWFSRLSSRLLELGFHGSQSDTSLFIFRTTTLTMFVLIYVDDIIITSPSPEAINGLLSTLKSDFAVKNLGHLKFFLGIEVIPNEHGVILSQQRYITDILTHQNA
jgi:hypothetical protein